jgi:hypothetical protein
MNSPATGRVGNGGCPGPTRQTERKHAARKSQSISPASRTGGWTEIDDLVQRRTKQVVLTVVARLAHRSPPESNLAIEGITNWPNRESRNAKQPERAPGFPANIDYFPASNHPDQSIASEFFTDDSFLNSSKGIIFPICRHI